MIQSVTKLKACWPADYPVRDYAMPPGTRTYESPGLEQSEDLTDALARSLHEGCISCCKDEVRAHVIWELADDSTRDRRREQARKLLEVYSIQRRA